VNRLGVGRLTAAKAHAKGTRASCVVTPERSVSRGWSRLPRLQLENSNVFHAAPVRLNVTGAISLIASAAAPNRIVPFRNFPNTFSRQSCRENHVF
jgi:hypothetical protein